MRFSIIQASVCFCSSHRLLDEVYLAGCIACIWFPCTCQCRGLHRVCNCHTEPRQEKRNRALCGSLHNLLQHRSTSHPFVYSYACLPACLPACHDRSMCVCLPMCLLACLSGRSLLASVTINRSVVLAGCIPCSCVHGI